MKKIILCDDTSLMDTVSLCEKYNLGIEIQSFYDTEYIMREKNSIDETIKATEKLESRSLHGPFADLNMGSFDKMIRDTTMNRFNFAYEIATRLGASDIVLHHGFVPKTSYPPNWIKRSLIFLEDFISHKKNNIKIHLENVLEYDGDMMSEIIKNLQTTNIDICLDIGHAHCNSKISVVDWIKCLKNKIGYVHMHDNNGIEDEHLGFGMGNIPLDDVCKALEEFSPKAIWAIESKVQYLQNSLEWLQRRGYFK